MADGRKMGEAAGMIYAYIGTGGSGKSLDMAQDIYNRVRKQRDKGHRNVIANFEVNRQMLYGDVKTHGLFYHFDNSVMTVENLKRYAMNVHKPPSAFKNQRDFEGQTLVCIDECQRFFNPREYARRDRMEWVTFFTEHRHYGFNFILTTPLLQLIDKQIVGCVEYVCRHRLMNNKGFIGFLLPFRLFAVSERWNFMPGKDGQVNTRFFTYKYKYDGLYDSYKHFVPVKKTKGN